MPTLDQDLISLERMARFPKGKPADPTSNMSPEAKAKWDAANAEYGDQFKKANGDMLRYFADNPDKLREKQMRDKMRDKKAGKLSCAMSQDCTKPVTMIDNQGYTYCTGHGESRKSSTPTRKLTQAEIQKLEKGEQVRYRKKADHDALVDLATLDMELQEASLPHIALDRDLAALEEIGKLAAIEIAANQQVAQTILDQMGGKGRLSLMTGANNFVRQNNPPGVAFKFPNRHQPAKGGNYVLITLDEGADLYDMEFKYLRGYQGRTVKKYTGIYGDQLSDIFEKQTGLYLRLASQQLERLKAATFEEGSRVPDGWDPGYVDSDPDATLDDEGSLIPDGSNNMARRASRLKWDHNAKDSMGRDIIKARSPNGDGDYIVQEYHDGKISWILAKPGESFAVGSPTRFRHWERAMADAENHAFRKGPWRHITATATAKLNVGPAGAFRFRWPFTYAHGEAENQLGIDIVSFDQPPLMGEFDAVFHDADNARHPAMVFSWTTNGMPAGLVVLKSDRKGMAEARREMARGGKVARSKAAYAAGMPAGMAGEDRDHWAQVMGAAENDAHAYAKRDARKAVQTAWDNYQKQVRRDLLDFWRSYGKKMAEALQAEWALAAREHRDNNRLGHDKEAGTGLYGFSKKVQADCESCVRKVQREASSIAKRAYGKNEKVAEFLSAHARRADSLPAQILVAALGEMGPKVASMETLGEGTMVWVYQGGLMGMAGIVKGEQGGRTLVEALWIPDNMSALPAGSPGSHRDGWKNRQPGNIQRVPTRNLSTNMAAWKQWVKHDYGESGIADKVLRMARLTELRAQHPSKEAAGPRGKAQKAIMDVVNQWPPGHEEALTDLIKFKPSFRGINFGQILNSAEILDKSGLIKFDGVTVTKKASAKKSSGAGAANAKYLNSLPSNQKTQILKLMANHYDISLAEAEDELIDPDAEALYEYLAADRPLAMKVMRDFKSRRLASDKEAGSYGLYGYSDKVASLGLSACSEMRAAAGRIAADLHQRRQSKHANITAFLDQHCKTAECRYSRLLAASYPEASSKVASEAPRTVQAWLDWDNE